MLVRIKHRDLRVTTYFLGMARVRFGGDFFEKTQYSCTSVGNV